jgi:hypothetical protein
MPRRNRNDEELEIRENDERDVEIPRFQVIDDEEEVRIDEGENTINNSSDSNVSSLSKLEISKKMETFRKRASITRNGFINYRMWLFDMSKSSSEKKKTKMLRESILSCFSHLISLNYIPTAIYHQLMYWLDDEIVKDEIVVEKTTYLMNLISEEKTLNSQDPEEWDTEPFKIGLKEDYESVGYTLFNYLVEARKAEGYYLPKFVHWETWYNNKCKFNLGLTKTIDRWATRYGKQPMEIDEQEEQAEIEDIEQLAPSNKEDIEISSLGRKQIGKVPIVRKLTTSNPNSTTSPNLTKEKSSKMGGSAAKISRNEIAVDVEKKEGEEEDDDEVDDDSYSDHSSDISPYPSSEEF